MKWLAVIGILVVALQGAAQTKSNDLLGMWHTCNENNNFYNSDSIIFYSDMVDCCNRVEWHIKKRNQLEERGFDYCTEPPKRLACPEYIYEIDGNTLNIFKVIYKDEKLKKVASSPLETSYKVIKLEQVKDGKKLIITKN